MFAVRRLVLLALTFVIISCGPELQETGTLEGHVTIVPLVPVVREGEPEPTPAAEVYASRQIVIYAQDRRTEITRVQIDAKGNDRVTLAVVTHEVDINRIGTDRGIDLPKTVEIASGQVTRVDVQIDTGIR